MPQVYRKNAITVEVNLNADSCVNCGVIYGVDAEFEAARRRDGKTFYCPNGHAMSFTETDAMRLKQERERNARLTASLDQSYAALAEEEKRRRAKEREIARLQKRIQNGVCTQCHRHFANLERHMASKHATVEVMP